MKISKEQKEAIEYYQNKEVSLSVDFDTENLLKALGITEEDSFENHQIRFKTLLNLIEKLQKKNEELKQDRNNNYQMIALAQNEMLGYMQGYEDGKKLKRSAVACVVENQQYYIMNKEIEHYKEYIQKLQKENEELEEINNELEAEKNEAIRRYNFETIRIKKVKDKIEELNKAYEDSKDENGESEYYYPDYTIRVLEELLESE